MAPWTFLLSLFVTAQGGGATPSQLSLNLHESGPTAMQINWISQDEYLPAQSTGSVTWGLVGQPTQSSPATSIHSYTAGPLGWNGTVFWGVMTGLTPGALHQYYVTSNGVSSNTSIFRAAPLPDASQTTRIAVLADMGSIELFGWTVALELIREHRAKPYDLIFIAGDLAYATIDPPKNEFQHLWDLWGLQNEPFSSTVPWMMTVGNHESTPGKLINSTGTYPSEFGSFTARWRMPRTQGGNGNLWYSYTYGPAMWVSMSSEHDYSIGSPQWLFIQSQFAACNRSEYPWLFLSLHRPIYSVDNDEVSSHMPGGALSVALEPLMRQYGVDVVFQGHEHISERTSAVFNGTTMTLPDANGVYTSPGAPIYIVQGNAGADLDFDHVVSPIPSWNLFHNGSFYGYGRMTLSTVGSNRVLQYEGLDTSSGAPDFGVVADKWSIVKPAV